MFNVLFMYNNKLVVSTTVRNYETLCLMEDYQHLFDNVYVILTDEDNRIVYNNVYVGKVNPEKGFMDLNYPNISYCCEGELDGATGVPMKDYVKKAFNSTKNFD